MKPLSMMTLSDLWPGFQVMAFL